VKKTSTVTLQPAVGKRQKTDESRV